MRWDRTRVGTKYIQEDVITSLRYFLINSARHVGEFEGNCLLSRTCCILRNRIKKEKSWYIDIWRVDMKYRSANYCNKLHFYLIVWSVQGFRRKQWLFKDWELRICQREKKLFYYVILAHENEISLFEKELQMIL